LESLFKLGVIVTTIDKLTGPARKMAQAVTNLEKTMQAARGMVEFGQRMSLSGALVQGAADKMMGILSNLMQPLMETQRALGEVASLGVKDLDSLDRAAREFTDNWAGTTKAQFITAAYDIKSGISSLTDAAVGDFTKMAALTAKATKATVGEMTSLLATGYGIYKDMYDKMSDAEFAQMFSAGIAASVQAFKTTGSGMAQAISTLGATATTAKRPLEEQLAVLGMLQATMTGGEAGTKYRAFIQSAASAGEKLGLTFVDNQKQLLGIADIIDRLRQKYGETLDAMEKQEIQKAFGTQEAVAVIDLFYNKVGDLRKSTESLGGAMKQGTSFIEQMASAMNTGPAAQLELLQQNIANFKEDIAKYLVPVLGQVTPVIKDILRQLSQFAQARPDLVKTAVVLAAVGAGALAILAPILTVAGAFIIMGGYALQGVTMAGRGIAWLKGKLTDKAILDAIRKIGSGMRTGFEAGGRAAMAAGRWVVSMGKNLGQAAVSAGRFALVAGGKALEAARAMGTALFNLGKQALFTAIRALPGLIASVWSFTAALLANPITWVVLAIIGLIAVIVLLIRHWDTVKVAVISAWETIKGAVGAGVAFVGNLANNFWLVIKGGIDKALAWLNGLWGTFQQSGRALWEAFTEGLKSVISKPVEVVKSGLAKIREMLPFSDAKTGPLSTLTRSGEAMVTTFQSGVEKKMEGLRKAVAAGLAGLALASPLPSFPSTPPAAVPRVADVITADVPDLSGLFPAATRPATVRAAGPRPVTINGDVHLHVDRVDSPEDLWQALRRFAEEVSG
jgi:TP901 family phage tail tape measure protein